MLGISTPAQLISLAAALTKGQRLTPPEAGVCRRVGEFPSAKVVSGLRTAIRSGRDPLGDAFTRLRTAEQRRPLGATYTPAAIVAAMLNWAQQQGEPERVIDPGAGSGRFLLGAARVFPRASLIGVEIDPLAALMLRANLSASGLLDRSKVIVGDYRRISLPPIKGRTLFIGNPPYVRHHDIEAEAKDWYGLSAARYGVVASKLAGLHLHFFVRTLQLAKASDFGCFITAAEWLDVNYGSALRALLAGPLGATDLILIDPKTHAFSDATTTSAITGFHVQSRNPSLRVRTVATSRELLTTSKATDIPWSALEKSPRWSIIIKPGAATPVGHVELGELCRVHRGQVTGSNNVWIAGPHSHGLPASVLRPTVTRARELIEAGHALVDIKNLRSVIDLPVDLDILTPADRRSVERFLAWAKRQGADESYIARHRRAWWSVGLKEPAPILCTYMARRAPAFVLNPRGARHINIAHGLYPREPLAASVLDALASWLRSKVVVSQGRTYAGGLTKFEPKEVERLPVPAPDKLASRVHG